jgi:CRISPR/Cas system-associated endonuclease Cas1
LVHYYNFQTWDLNRFANEWKFSFEEVDDPLEITNKLLSKFNTNLNLDTTLGEIVKVGLKFGISLKSQNQTPG